MISSLKGSKKIEVLFQEGFSIKKEGLVLKGYMFNDGKITFGVSVPKKNFKSAVKRNLLKRRIREAVRNSNNLSLVPFGFSFFVVYNFKNVLESKEIRMCIDSLLLMLTKKIN